MNIVLILLIMVYIPSGDEAFKNAESQFVTKCFEPYMYISSCSLHQDRNEWVIKYRFDQPIDPTELDINISGYMSNSTSDQHTIPRFYKVEPLHKNYIYRDSVGSDDPSKQCSELLEYKVQNKDLIITLTHKHAWHDHIPLLGLRHIKIKNGLYHYFGILDLRNESKYIPAGLDYNAAKEAFDIWNKKENIAYFNSDSDYLREIFGEYFNWNYLRFPEIPVKPSEYNKYKLSFWYKVLKKSDGQFNLRFDEYQQDSTISSWSVKNNSKITLKQTSEWIYYSSIITLNKDTNAVAISFNFYESEFGEAWVKEVDLRSIKKIPGLSGQLIDNEINP